MLGVTTLVEGAVCTDVARFIFRDEPCFVELMYSGRAYFWTRSTCCRVKCFDMKWKYRKAEINKPESLVYLCTSRESAQSIGTKDFGLEVLGHEALLNMVVLFSQFPCQRMQHTPAHYLAGRARADRKHKKLIRICGPNE